MASDTNGVGDLYLAAVPPPQELEPASVEFNAETIDVDESATGLSIPLSSSRLGPLGVLATLRAGTASVNGLYADAGPAYASFLGNDYPNEGRIPAELTSGTLDLHINADTQPEGAEYFYIDLKPSFGLVPGSRSTIRVNINETNNSAPFASDDYATAPLGTATTLTPLSNDWGATGLATATVMSFGTSGGSATIDGTTIRYQAPASGPVFDRIDYTATGTGAGVATASVWLTDTFSLGVPSTATLTASPSSGQAPLPASLEAVTIPAGFIADCSIDFGDGQAGRCNLGQGTDTTFTAAHTYRTAGTYTVTLRVLDHVSKLAFSNWFDFWHLPPGTAVATAITQVFTASTTNRPPLAVDDAVVATTFRTTGVQLLTNDTDPDGDPLAVASFSNTTSAGGTLACSDGHRCDYTPRGVTRAQTAPPTPQLTARPPATRRTFSSTSSRTHPRSL